MPTLIESLTTYLQLDRAQKTNRQYAYVLRRLVAAIGPDRAVELVRYEDLVDYFGRLRAEGRKPSTLNGYLAIVKAFFGWCVEVGYLRANPAARLRMRKPAPNPDRSHAIPPDDLRQLVEAARFSSRRDYAILLFLADTGCRAVGLCSLTLERLDLDGLTAVLIEKGGRPHRVYFSEQTAKALRDWLAYRPAVDHRSVWTSAHRGRPPLTPGGVAAMMRTLCKTVGLSRTYGPHSIRHAFGHAYAARGVNPRITQRALGHADLQITIEHYYPDGDEQVRAAARRTAAPGPQGRRRAGQAQWVKSGPVRVP